MSRYSDRTLKNIDPDYTSNKRYTEIVIQKKKDRMAKENKENKKIDENVFWESGTPIPICAIVYFLSKMCFLGIRHTDTPKVLLRLQFYP